MGHRVGLQEPGPGDVPVVGAHGDVMLEQAAGFGGAASTMPQACLARGQQPVGVRATHRQHILAGLLGELAVLALVVRQPQGQQGRQAHPGGLLGRLPDPPKHLHHRLTVARGTALAHRRVAAPAAAGVQQLDGVLAAVAKLLAQLIDHARSPLAPPSRVPLAQSRQHLFSDLLTHGHHLRLPVSSFLSQRPSPLPLPHPSTVSKLMSEQALTRW